MPAGQPLRDKGDSDTDAARLPADVTDDGQNVTDDSEDVTAVSQLPDGLQPNATADCHGVTDDTVGLEGVLEAPAGKPETGTKGGDDTCLI